MDFHGRLYRIPTDIRKQRIAELLRLVEIEDRKNDIVKTFSGGMRRRLEIARGLLHQTDRKSILCLGPGSDGSSRPPANSRSYRDFIADLQCSQRAYLCADAAAGTLLPNLKVRIDQLQRTFGAHRDTATAISADIAVNRQSFSLLIQQAGESSCVFSFLIITGWPLNRYIRAMTAGMIRIAPARENPTVITVVIPKFEMILNSEKMSAANPNTVVRPTR